jgi:hypothetical protein
MKEEKRKKQSTISVISLNSIRLLTKRERGKKNIDIYKHSKSELATAEWKN